MHSSVAPRHGPAEPCPNPPRRSITVFDLEAALPYSGATMTLDAVLRQLGPCETTAYALVANAVRSGTHVVVFEADPKTFPYRRLMICRL